MEKQIDYNQKSFFLKKVLVETNLMTFLLPHNSYTYIII